MRALPDRKYRLAHHRGDQSLEAAPICGELRFQNGVVVIDDRIANRRDGAERAQGLRGKHRAHHLKILVRALYPYPTIGVQQDILGVMVIKAGSDQRPEFTDQLFIAAFSHLQKFLHPLLPMRGINWPIFYPAVCELMVLYIQTVYDQGTLLRSCGALVKSKR